MTTLTVAAVQFDLRAERSFDAFARHVGEAVDRAASAGAELVVLPELVTTGLLATTPDGPVRTATVGGLYRTLLPSHTADLVSLVTGLAARHSITLLGGSHYRVTRDGQLRNTAYLAHPDGRLETQDKLHLTPPERAMGASGGDDVLVTRIGPFTAGVLICADIQFPELSRHLVDRGADLVLTPSLTWNRRGAHRVRYGAHARAMENQLYVVTAPLVGSSGLPEDAPLHCTGAAVVTGPIDRTIGAHDGVLAEAAPGGEDVLVATLDVGKLRVSREHPESPGLALRRPDLYERLRPTPSAP